MPYRSTLSLIFTYRLSLVFYARNNVAGNSRAGHRAFHDGRGVRDEGDRGPGHRGASAGDGVGDRGFRSRLGHRRNDREVFAYPCE